MKNYLFAASVDGVNVDFEEIITSDTAPGYWECAELAAAHNCEFWTCEEVSA